VGTVLEKYQKTSTHDQVAHLFASRLLHAGLRRRLTRFDNDSRTNLRESGAQRFFTLRFAKDERHAGGSSHSAISQGSPPTSSEAKPLAGLRIALIPVISAGNGPKWSRNAVPGGATSRGTKHLLTRFACSLRDYRKLGAKVFPCHNRTGPVTLKRRPISKSSPKKS